MGLLYAIVSILLTFFYSRQITHVICFGRNRDRENIKSKKAYYIIYAFWILFFGVLCLIMGSATGINTAFDRALDYYELSWGGYDYREGKSIYDENDYKYQGDFTLIYYARKNEDNLEDLIVQIVKENNFIYKRYQLDEMEVVYDGQYYCIYEKGVVLSKVTVENSGILKKISYQWSRGNLEQCL